MLLATLAGLALAGIAGYQYKKNKDKDKKNSSTSTTSTTDTETTTNKAQNIYNYNYLNDSNTGNTLFSSKQKTRRAIFGGEV